MKTIHYMNKVFFVFILFLSSCGENSSLSEETIYFDEANKDWVIDSELGDHFIMKDNNGISQSFAMNEDHYEFSKSWSIFLGITTEITNTEYHYQNFSSNYGTRFSLSLTARSDPYGDEIYISLNDLGFSYDFSFETIGRMDTPFGYLSKMMYDTGYGDEQISSQVEILDSFEVNGLNYSGVLHFTFNDFRPYWQDFTIKEIYVAKKIGLIQFQLNNGITYERQ